MARYDNVLETSDKLPLEHGLGGFDPKATYSAAAEEYERASQRYWQFLSTRSVEQLDLGPGQSVLDAACGTGPAVIAAARRVGPGGRVVGVDYADGMLAVVRRNVSASGVPGVELVRGDMLALPYGEEFDAVICVLGIFFVGDMAAAARALWSHVRSGASRHRARIAVAAHRGSGRARASAS